MFTTIEQEIAFEYLLEKVAGRTSDYLAGNKKPGLLQRVWSPFSALPSGPSRARVAAKPAVKPAAQPAAKPAPAPSKHVSQGLADKVLRRRLHGKLGKGILIGAGLGASSAVTKRVISDAMSDEDNDAPLSTKDVLFGAALGGLAGGAFQANRHHALNKMIGTDKGRELVNRVIRLRAKTNALKGKRTNGSRKS